MLETQIFHRQSRAERSEAIVNQVNKRRPFGLAFVYSSRLLVISGEICGNAPSSFLRPVAAMWLLHPCRKIKFSLPFPHTFNIYIFRMVWPFGCRLGPVQFLGFCVCISLLWLLVRVLSGSRWPPPPRLLIKKDEENEKNRTLPSELTGLTFFHISADPNRPTPPSGTRDTETQQIARHLGWKNKYDG